MMIEFLLNFQLTLLFFALVTHYLIGEVSLLRLNQPIHRFLKSWIAILYFLLQVIQFLNSIFSQLGHGHTFMMPFSVHHGELHLHNNPFLSAFRPSVCYRFQEKSLQFLFISIKITIRIVFLSTYLHLKHLVFSLQCVHFTLKLLQFYFEF